MPVERGRVVHRLSPWERLAFPLDVATLEDARRLIDVLTPEVRLFKVGLELFTAVGPDAVHAVHDRGASCFLDLKLHDIPATVAHAVRAAARLRVRYLTVHAAAGPAALTAAQEASGDDLELLAVTVLTSLATQDLGRLGVTRSLEDTALAWAEMATECGVPGLVCSPHECPSFRRALGRSPLLVVPGVRPTGSAADDQARVATPASALAGGADILVVGRPIRNAPDPRAAAAAVLAEIERS